MAEKNRIREHREMRGLSQAQLAAMCNTSLQQISRLELGQRVVSGHWLTLLSKALNVPKGALLLAPSGDGTEPIDCDIVQDGLERMLLSFWRDLPNEGKRAVLKSVTTWANDTVGRAPAARSA